MNIVIKKAKIKNKLFLTFEYIQKDRDVKNNISTSSDAPVHQDLTDAFNLLTPHLVLICEESSDTKVAKDIIKNGFNESNEHLLAKYKITGFTVAGSGDSEGAVITGYKVLESEKVVNLNTPFIQWEDDYLHNQNLIEVIETCKSEVFEYMQGKQAPKTQQELDFRNEDENENDLPI